ncbi:MAG TPA: hypothetical protein PL105_19655, partial [Caldilineaceae bacterium]|nr:hypothetical protein [Caldilineaceae bacterium]
SLGIGNAGRATGEALYGERSWENSQGQNLTRNPSQTPAVRQNVIAESLTITDSQTFTAGLSVTNGLTVTGALTVSQGLTVTGRLVVSGSLVVSGGLSVVAGSNPSLFVPEIIQGGMTITDKRAFTQGLSITGDLTVTGALTVFEGLTVTETIAVYGSLVVAESAEAPLFQSYLPAILRYSVIRANNGGFELGPVQWDEYSSTGQNGLIRSAPELAVPPHTGYWAARLGGQDNDLSMLSQGVSIAKENACLVFWQWTQSKDACSADYGGVGINGKWVDVHSLCAGTSTAGWARRQISMTQYSTAITSTLTVLNFAVVNDYSVPSTLYLDDVAFYPTTECDLQRGSSLADDSQARLTMSWELIGQEINIGK